MCCPPAPTWKDSRGIDEQCADLTQSQEHCRVFKDETGRVLGAIQLQLPGDLGDLGFPESMRGDKLELGEVHLEFIECHPDATGKGIGSKLLKWADTFAASNGCQFITLDVRIKPCYAPKKNSA